MANETSLTALHVDVARIYFDLRDSEGYVVAGGAGLLASDLIARPTEDLDLFASTPIDTVAEAAASFLNVKVGQIDRLAEAAALQITA